jgi:hypothetical protein
MDLKEEVIDRVEAVVESIDCDSIAAELNLNDPELGVLDAVQEKLISRKLLVFGVATALMLWADLDPDTWGMIAVMYIGGQSAIDLAKTWRNG